MGDRSGASKRLSKPVASCLGIVLVLLSAFLASASIGSTERVQFSPLASPAVKWSLTYGGPDDDRAYAVVQTSDYGYALAGFTSTGALPTDYDFWLIKTSFKGILLWDRTYGSDSVNEYAYSMIQTSDGGFALAGSIAQPTGGSLFWLVKTDSNGNMQWNRSYGYPGAYQSASAVIQTADSGYALAGSPNLVVKTDADGNMQWMHTYGNPNVQDNATQIRIEDIVQSLASTGGFAITGYSYFYGGESGYYGISHRDFWLGKTDSQGTLLWEKTYRPTNPPGSNEAHVYSMIQTSDEGYLLAGSGSGQIANGAWIVKTDSAGSMLWSQTNNLDLPSGGEIHAVIVETGGYAFAGSIPTTKDHMLLILTDSMGKIKGNVTFAHAENGSIIDSYANSLVQNSEGGYALAGYSSSNGASQDNFLLVELYPAPQPTPTPSPTPTPKTTPTPTPSPSPKPSPTPTSTPSLSPSSLFNIVINHTGQGRTNPPTGSYRHPHLANLVLSAVPDSGYTFKCWLQNSIFLSSENPYNHTVTGNYAITAVFEPSQQSSTPASPTGTPKHTPTPSSPNQTTYPTSTPTATHFPASTPEFVPQGDRDPVVKPSFPVVGVLVTFFAVTAIGLVAFVLFRRLLRSA